MNFTIITHGGFEFMRDVWIFISSIFGSTEFKGFMTAVFLFALIVSAIQGTLMLAFDPRRWTPMQWMKIWIIVTLMVTTMLPATATVTIYDDVSNQTYIQGNAPAGISAIAGFVNELTIGLENLIASFITTPMPPEDLGYDLGIKMLQDSFDGVLKAAFVTSIHSAYQSSITNYAADCVALKAAREEDYRNQLDKTTDLISVFSAAGNPALMTFTNLDAGGNPLGANATSINVSCQDAWNRINAFLANNQWDDAIQTFCDAMRFDGNVAVSLNRCKDILENTFQEYILGGGAMSSNEIAQNLSMGVAWYNYLAQLDDNIEAARLASYSKASSDMTGMAIMAQEYMPVIKYIVFGTLCSMTILTAIFFVTQFGLEAFKFLLASFIWWGVWCAIDQMMVCMWLNRTQTMFDILNTSAGLGLSGLTSLWPLTSKAMAMLGAMRSMGALLSGAMVFGILKFGGSAFGHLAARLSGMAGAGAGSAAAMLAPEATGWSKTMSDMAGLANQHSAAVVAEEFGGISGFYSKSGDAKVFGTISDIASTGIQRQAFGGGQVQAATTAGVGKGFNAVESAQQGLADLNMFVSPEIARKTKDYAAGKKLGEAGGLERAHGSPENYALYEADNTAFAHKERHAYLDTMNRRLGPGAAQSVGHLKADQTGQNQIKNFRIEAISSALQNGGQVSPGLQRWGRTLANSAPWASHYMAYQFQDNDLGNLTPERAESLNNIAERSGFGRPFAPGMVVSGSFGYDPKTGQVILGSYQAKDQAGNVTSGVSQRGHGFAAVLADGSKKILSPQEAREMFQHVNDTGQLPEGVSSIWSGEIMATRAPDGTLSAASFNGTSKYTNADGNKIRMETLNQDGRIITQLLDATHEMKDYSAYMAKEAAKWGIYISDDNITWLNKTGEIGVDTFRLLKSLPKKMQKAIGNFFVSGGGATRILSKFIPTAGVALPAITAAAPAAMIYRASQLSPEEQQNITENVKATMRELDFGQHDDMIQFNFNGLDGKK